MHDLSLAVAGMEPAESADTLSSVSPLCSGSVFTFLCRRFALALAALAALVVCLGCRGVCGCVTVAVLLLAVGRDHRTPLDPLPVTAWPLWRSRLGPRTSDSQARPGPTKRWLWTPIPRGCSPGGTRVRAPRRAFHAVLTVARRVSPCSHPQLFGCCDRGGPLLTVRWPAVTASNCACRS